MARLNRRERERGDCLVSTMIFVIREIYILSKWGSNG